MRICKIVATFTTVILLMLPFSVHKAHAHAFDIPYGGSASSTIEYGSPMNVIAYYNASGELNLGVRCVGYASATAIGNMYVCAKATSTGWVTGTMYWYIYGRIASGGVPDVDAYVTVTLEIHDKTAQTTDTEVLLHTHTDFLHEWRLDTVDIPLYADHRYYFYLNATVHAHAFGIAAAVADFEGFWYGEPDYQIRWGFLDVPNTIADVGGGGSGCPYVYAWNGQRYVMDNNLLPASEITTGDVEDYYRLEQLLVPTGQGTFRSAYSLRIQEFENEHDFFDQVKLLAVDHSSDVNVAVTPYGEILTYSNPAPSISAADDNNIDVLFLLSSVDENYYQGYNGSYVTLTFASTDLSNGAKLVIREDFPGGGPPPTIKCPVYIQTLNATGDWSTVAVFHTRTYWATDIINMADYLPDANGDLKVRFCFVSNDKIDYVGLDTTSQASIEVHQASSILAFHSTQGNVRWRLLQNDDIYAELVPDEQIQLTFLLPNNQNQKRTFILYTEGHYTRIET